MADLQIGKKTVSKLFSDMQGKKFIIPDYQRPYRWNIEKCEILWEDIVNFFESSADDKTSDYFLGTIVTYINESGNEEIIDGQQRITTFLLLLRAFYKKLANMPEDNKVRGLKGQIEPCIWDIDDISNEVVDFSNIRICSDVATEEDNNTFHTLLEKGELEISNKSRYLENYLFFLNKCDEYAKDKPLKWYELCVTFLKRCIILPIECQDQDTALTIFSTLNDRGMPLEDSDIFKSQLYKTCHTTEEKDKFIEQWKELDEICTSGGLSINDIFRYYTHIIRARKGEVKREIGLRSFYSENKYEKFQDSNLMNELSDLAKFWALINKDYKYDNKYIVYFGYDAKRFLHCMKYYPNEYWKYLVSVFFIQNKSDTQNFYHKFSAFMQQVVAYYYAKFIIKPTVNAVKDDTFNFYCNLVKDGSLSMPKPYQNDELFIQEMNKYDNSRLTKGLLLLQAYLDPEQGTDDKGFLVGPEIPDNFEIEHILPKKWQNTNYNGWLFKDAETYLENFGNKVVIEKKLNIEANNNYFAHKKVSYHKSKIQLVKKLSGVATNDWSKDEIIQRHKIFENTMLDFFNKHLA